MALVPIGSGLRAAKASQEVWAECFNLAMTFFLDKKTKLIAAVSVKANDPNLGGDYLLNVTYDDYKAVAGVQLPHEVVIDIADGALILTRTYTETAIPSVG